MQRIKNIIFDLGGIFIDIHFSKTEEAFAKLGIENFNLLYNQHHASDIFAKLETGAISPEAFYDTLRIETNKNSLTNKEIESAWIAMLGDYFLPAIEWLDEIKNRYKIFLFSNTNAIHVPHLYKIFKAQTGKESFENFFITTYYSHNLGLRKPHEDSFKAILEKEKLTAAETLFIDDTEKNIVGAKLAGLQTIHLVHPKKVEELPL